MLLKKMEHIHCICGKFIAGSYYYKLNAHRNKGVLLKN